MVTVAVVSPGHMGAGLGAALSSGGARVVATTAGRSDRTRRLAADAGLELLPSLDDVVAAAGVVLLVTPPAAALATAREVAAAARTTGANPIVADLNAVSPQTMGRIAEELRGLRVVDGSISGPPPSVKPGAWLYFAGPDAAAVANLPWDGQVKPIVLGVEKEEIGAASALKMCTGGVYKGLTALVTQAMRTAEAYGVLDEVVTDLERDGLDRTAGVVQAATKAHRFVGEMREISVTQQAVGLTPALYAAIADVYADIARTELAAGDPETARRLSPGEIVERLAERHPSTPGDA